MKNSNIKYISKIKYYLLILFIIIQPILDIHYLYTKKVVSIIGFSPSTIIRVIIVTILALMTVITLRDKKIWSVIIGYLLLILVYTIFHIINTKNLYTLVPDNLGYSIIGEIFYIVRMLIPLIIIIITINTKVDRKDYERVIKIVLLSISLTIVISNILKISLVSYGNGIIKENIFGWFTGAYEIYEYSDLASRGFFNSANQISALLILLLPIMLTIYSYQQNIKNLLIIILTLISMVMLGTKVALYGAIIDMIIYFLVLVFMIIIKKDKIFSKKIFYLFGISVFIIGTLYKFSPVVNRPSLEENYGNVEEVVQIEELNEYQKNNENDKVIEFIKNNYELAKIKDDFIINSYPYNYDPEFWINVFEMPLIKRRDWRLLELKMHQRVMDINNNPNDKWLGIGFTRSEHLFTLERDFIAQYYSMGMLGVILLLGPYVLIIIACFIKILLRFKEKFDIRNSITCLTVVFVLGASINSGNVMDCLTITIILGFIIGKLTEDIFLK